MEAVVLGLLDTYCDAAFAVQCFRIRIRHQPPQFFRGCHSALSIGRKLKFRTQAARMRAICFFFLNCLRLPAFPPPPLKPTERGKIAKMVWFQVFVYPPLTFKRLDFRAEILKTVRGMFLV